MAKSSATRPTFRFVYFEIRELRLPFRFSFGHALAKRRRNTALIVVLVANDGSVGYGEVLPREYLSGETIDGARNALRNWAEALARIRLPWAPTDGSAVDAHALAPAWEALGPLYEEADSRRHTAAYAGLDVAAIDCYARHLGLPGSRFFATDEAAKPEAVTLTAALGYRGPRATGWAARLARVAGFRDFKIKLGRPDDAARLAAARRALGKLPLRGDANGAWPPSPANQDAARRVWLEQYAVDSVEQPCPAADGPSALAAARGRLGKPVVADESLVTRADAEALLAAGAADIWNLRVGKVGGFSGMRALTALARRHGVDLHLGVLVGETAVLGAATRACLGLGPFRHVEYGFTPLLLRRDPFAPGPPGLRGLGPPLDDKRPGLGVSPHPATIKRDGPRYEIFNFIADEPGLTPPEACLPPHWAV